ncbi:PLP-dependent aminotransferase family protein [Yinghuangia seranimata]|uniref:aminotransferase-like domain-containing protein n=1 Tax=Yinghuangia seranimata TaxID=408067 RepID=UPI00248CDAA4|nr:PLP-dependent aminotransferase family protein [Yinghuangia seranimata]MDI2131979.1 PLP-dependent aminotransferase family protein [Yinghuangia seranimata]
MDVERFAMLVGERLRRPRRNERRSRGERLADALEALVRSGDLLPETRLPSERALGVALGVSRGTVASALDQLAAEGLVERRHGSGTYVRAVEATDPRGEDAGPVGAAAEPVGAGAVPEPIFRRWLREGTVVVDLAKSVVPDASLLPRLDLAVEDLLDVHPADGYGHLGDDRLRELLAVEAAPGTAPPERLLVTSGAQQGLHLVADALLEPGDRVLVEEVTYPGMLAAVARFGGVPVAVPSDRHGFLPDAFADAVARHRPVFAFAMPVHNPTGAVAAERRMRALAAAARDGGTLLVEDRTLADLVLPPHTGPAPSAAPYAPEATVCVGSLSKTLWGGLRVGWVVAPEPVFGRLAEAKQRADLASSALDQRLAVALLADPDAQARRAAWRAELAVRRDHLSGLLAERLPDWSWSDPIGGMSLWVRLGRRGKAAGAADGEEFAELARRHGVAVSPGAVFGPPGSTAVADRIRLSYGWPEPVLSEAVTLLARAWAAYAAGGTARG